MAKRSPLKAAGRYAVYGSTRYSTQGSTKSHPRLKTFGSRLGGSWAGSTIGGAVGAIASRGNPQAAAIGSSVGLVVGGHAGSRFAAKQGYVRRTKQRMSLRAVNANFGKADHPFHASRHLHTMGGMR